MIVVYGASGTTGRLCALALAHRGVRLVLAGRDRTRLEVVAAEVAGAEIRVAAVHDAAALAAAFRGATVVVSTAGPFVQVGQPVLAAAIEAGAHYLDTTGEQRFLRETYEGFESRARHAGVTCVPSCAFEVVLGDLAAARAAALLRTQLGEPADAAVDELAIAYAIDAMQPTPGTQLSALGSLGDRGVVWQDDRWVPVALAAHARTIAFPAPFGSREAISFPSGEVITVPRHVNAGRVEAFLSLGSSPWIKPGARLLGLAAPFLAPLAGPLAAALRGRIGAVAPPSPAAMAETRFAVLAEAQTRFHRARVAVTGHDPYRVTAALIADAATEWLARPPARAGVLAPAEAFPADPWLARLCQAHGLGLDEHGG